MKESIRACRVSVWLCVAMLGFSQVALAEEQMEEIIVVGMRSSLASAVEQKRNSDNLIEVIEAIDIGKLPDQNLAEVLENVTGIQITREAGVGTGVQIRGTNANRTEINGVSTVGSGAGRTGIDFEDVAASIISSVEVVKAPQADTIEGSVGGTINLKTIRPLELNESIAAFRIQGENSSLSEDDKIQPRISGTWGDNWSTDNGELGVVLSGSWSQQNVSAFRPRTDRDNSVLTGSGADSEQSFDFLPIQFLIQDYDNFEYETINFTGSFEWAPTDQLKFYFDAVINDQERLQESHRIQASGVSGLKNISTPTSFETIDFGSGLGSIQAARTGVIPIEADGSDPNLRTSTDTSSRETSSKIFSLGGEWTGERLSARVEISSSKSDTKTPAFNTTLNFINPNVDTNSSNENGTPFIYALGNKLTWGIAHDESNAPTVAQLLNPENYMLRDVNINQDEVENEENAFRLDFAYDLDWGPIASLDFGYRYNASSNLNNDVRTRVGLRNFIDSPTGDLFASVITRGPDNFDDGDGRDLFVPHFLMIDPEKVNSNPEQVLTVLNEAIVTNAATTGSERGPLNQPTSVSDAFFDIEEKTHAFYAQANFEQGPFRGNVGFRFVDTDVNSRGNSVLNGVAEPRKDTASYNFVLPRFNVAWDVRDDVVIRLAYTADIRRPDFDDLSLSTTFDTSPNPPVEIGNPDLEPEEVDSWDVGVEWYFAEGALFSVGYFHKERTGLHVKTQNNPFEDPTTGHRDITAPCEQGGIFNPIADINVFGPVGVGVCVPSSTTINGPGETTQKGFEIAFQYDLASHEEILRWASGFGVIANFTQQEFSGSDTFWTPTSRANTVFTALGNPNYRQRATLVDLSETAYNFTLYYEKYGISARARYTWRQGYRSTDFGSTSSFPWGFPVIQEDRGQLNANVSYTVNEKLSVSVQAINLTASEVEQSCVNEGALLCYQGLTDRRITFGASYRF